ncbi:MAG: glycosyltransferase family 4 protein [Candidatus Dojkabacteria bacterium]|nr:glycosyltransferase family 4 protein [Candidatus Dojkabacteria bacterium]
MKSVKVGLVMDTTLDSDAGVQQVFKGLARYLLKSNYDVRFLVPPSKDVGEFKGKVISFGKEVVVKGNANTIQTVFGFGKRQIIEVLDREKFDLIHVSAPFSPFLGAKVVELAACPVVSTYMVYGANSLFRFAAQLLRIPLRKAYGRIDAFIASSDAAKVEAESVIPGKYKIIPHGVDLTRYSAKVPRIEKFDDKKVNILTVGRFEKRKGVEYLIRAFAKLKQKTENVRLIIAGDGPLRKKLYGLVEELKLDDVYFEGYIPEELKPSYYATADICVFPAVKGECFGIVLIESMASGRPTIAFSNEGYRYVLRNLPELLVENKSVDKLAQKLIELLEHKGILQKYGELCRREAEKYSWDNVGRQIIEVYEKLLAKK